MFEQIELLNRFYANSYFQSGMQRANELDGLYGLGNKEIMKALATDGSVGSDGSGLIGESLDPVVKDLTRRSPNFTPMIKRLYTYEARAISEEYTRLTSLGLSEFSWRGEGKLGVQDASELARIFKNIKYMGQTGAVTEAMQRAGAAKFGDVKSFEMTNRLHKLLLDLESAIIWADPDYNSKAFEGILKQRDTSNEFNIDLAETDTTATGRVYIKAGGTLSSASIRAHTEKFMLTGGSPTALICAPTDKNSISSAEDSKIRWFKEKQVSKVASGMIVDQIDTDFGEVDVVWNIHMRNERGKLFSYPSNPAGKFHKSAPAQLPANSLSAAVQAGGKIAPGTFFYAVAAVNDVSEGPILILNQGQVCTDANGEVEVTVTKPANHATTINSYRLYRSAKASGHVYTDFAIIGEFKNDANATQVLTDTGAFVPGSRRALTINERMKALGFLEPPVMYDLARTDNTHRCTVDCMAVVQVYAPSQVVHHNNIGGDVFYGK